VLKKSVVITVQYSICIYRQSNSLINKGGSEDSN